MPAIIKIYTAEMAPAMHIYQFFCMIHTYIYYTILNRKNKMLIIQMHFFFNIDMNLDMNIDMSLVADVSLQVKINTY